MQRRGKKWGGGRGPCWKVGGDPRMTGKGLWSADYRKLLKIKYGRGRQEVYFQNINP